VFKYCFILIVLGQDTSTQGSMEGKHRGDKGYSGGMGLTVCCEQQVIKPSVKRKMIFLCDDDN
jgi:hypothetical protein